MELFMNTIASLLPKVNVGDKVLVVYLPFADSLNEKLPAQFCKSEGIVLNCVPHMLLLTWVYTVLLDNGILVTDALYLDTIDTDPEIQHKITMLTGVNIEAVESDEHAKRIMKSPIEFELYKLYKSHIRLNTD